MFIERIQHASPLPQLSERVRERQEREIKGVYEVDAVTFDHQKGGGGQNQAFTYNRRKKQDKLQDGVLETAPQETTPELSNKKGEGAGISLATPLVMDRPEQILQALVLASK